MSKDYSKIREMLEAQESFPFDYIHKVIGRNTPAFLDSVAALESRCEGFSISAPLGRVEVALQAAGRSPVG